MYEVKVCVWDVFTQNKEVIAIKQGVFGDRFHTAAPVSIKLPQQYNTNSA
jgi:hypothetical protein